MDAFAWAEEATGKLKAEFGERLRFAGIQGSRARGEAREGSDIDLVVLLDHVDADDLVRYRTIVQSMPHSELACGFVGSERALAAWPRHELFQFYHDTHAIFGALPNIGSFTKDDALQAARIGASGIYHATCHAYVFDGNAADSILESLFKGAFFTLQALQFARTGAYPRTKAELAAQLEGDEARILEAAAIGKPTARKTTLSAESSSTCSYAGRKASSPNSEMRKRDSPFFSFFTPVCPRSLRQTNRGALS